jgi:mRNA-degrading endonuclease RelE of RelBE toxin-antitoxin system
LSGQRPTPTSRRQRSGTNCARAAWAQISFELSSKSRIKRLRGIRRPRYRLRIGDIRVFYDVTDKAVEVLAIVPKSQAAAWLKRYAL